jgi:hypothetical protein
MASVVAATMIATVVMAIVMAVVTRAKEEAEAWPPIVGISVISVIWVVVGVGKRKG